MIEEKLRKAAQDLPEAPECYDKIVEQARGKYNHHSAKVLKRTVIACICICLLACGTVFAASGIKYAAWPKTTSYNFTRVTETAEQMNLVLPEKFGEYCFDGFTVCRVVPAGTCYLKVLLGSPLYLRYSIDYSMKDSDDTSFRLDMGSTENSLYRYCFYFDNHDIWQSEYLVSGTYHSELYKGIVLQSGITKVEENSDSFYEINWIDSAHEAVFSMHCVITDKQNFGDIEKQMTDYAKYVINCNIAG